MLRGPCVCEPSPRRTLAPGPVRGIRLGGALAALLLAALAGFLPALAGAEPQAGFGVLGGLAEHYGQVQLKDGGYSGFASNGLSAGAEYQWLLRPDWTLVGFAQASVESVSGAAADLYVSTSHPFAGIEVRYWDGAKFVGAHAGAFSELLTAKSGAGTSDTQANGMALGVVGGWEGSRGWFAVGQADLAEVAFRNAVHGLTGLRIGLGYRWRRE